MTEPMDPGFNPFAARGGDGAASVPFEVPPMMTETPYSFELATALIRDNLITMTAQVVDMYRKTGDPDLATMMYAATLDKSANPYWERRILCAHLAVALFLIHGYTTGQIPPLPECDRD